MKSYLINGKHFRTQKEALGYLQGVLHQTPLGLAVNDEDSLMLHSLIRFHPDYEAKVGAGILGFEVRSDDQRGGTRHFVIVRTDGSRTDFSYRKCLVPISKHTLFREACRHTIAEQIIDFRNTELASLDGRRLLCPVLGIHIGSDQVHVDHVPPWTFNWLVTRFVAARNVDVDAVILTGFRDNEIRKGFEDPRLRDEWLSFHQLHARLRIVSKKANLSEIRKAARIACVAANEPISDDHGPERSPPGYERTH